MTQASDPTASRLLPKCVPLPAADERYTRLLGCPADTAGMKSGCVILAPGECVGLHSTESNEEILVPLSGCGELRIPGLNAFSVRPGCVLYNPPHTAHDVVNTGDEPLRYIFIVAPAVQNQA